MATLTLRNIKGSALTFTELDSNFSNINTEVAGKAATSHTHGIADLTATGTRSATTFLRGDNTFATPAGSAPAPTVTALTDGATIAVAAAHQVVFTVTLAGNRTLANPTGLVAGQTFQIFIRQDATGSRTLAYGTNWKFPNAVAPILTTTASALDVLTATYDGTTLAAVITKAFG